MYEHLVWNWAKCFNFNLIALETLLDSCGVEWMGWICSGMREGGMRREGFWEVDFSL
jgi:hypothetical protein